MNGSECLAKHQLRGRSQRAGRQVRDMISKAPRQLADRTTPTPPIRIAPFPFRGALVARRIFFKAQSRMIAIHNPEKNRKIHGSGWG